MKFLFDIMADFNEANTEVVPNKKAKNYDGGQKFFPTKSKTKEVVPRIMNSYIICKHFEATICEN